MRQQASARVQGHGPVCFYCGAARVIRYGHTRKGKQRWRCYACGRCSVDSPGSAAHEREWKATILEAYRTCNCSSLRQTSRVFGISRNTLRKWIGQSQQPDYDGPHPVCIRQNGCPTWQEMQEWLATNKDRVVETVEPMANSLQLMGLLELARRLEQRRRGQGD